MTASLPEIHALWIGSHLSKISVACLSSFAAVGHRVILHVYDQPDNVPTCVETRDASMIAPREHITTHQRTGSYALFSDIFRYRLLSQGADIYVDCDVYCVRPIPRSDYVFGFEDNTNLNGAVLALPQDSELLATLASIAGNPHFIPPWLSTRRKRKLQMRKMLGFPQHVSQMQWGVLGPLALTHYTQHYKLECHASTPDVFYPIDYRRIELLLDPQLEIDDLITKRTLCIHLYNEALRGKTDNIHKDSPLGRMLSI